MAQQQLVPRTSERPSPSAPFLQHATHARAHTQAHLAQPAAATRHRAVYLTRKPRIMTRLVAAVLDAPQAQVAEYFSAGQSWCGYSQKQQQLLAQPTAAALTRVKYIDCTAGGASATHPACTIQPQPRGFPYLAKCQGAECTVARYGFAPAEELERFITAAAEV